MGGEEVDDSLCVGIADGVWRQASGVAMASWCEAIGRQTTVGFVASSGRWYAKREIYFYTPSFHHAKIACRCAADLR